MNFCDYVKRIGLPLVISPIVWLTRENRRLFPLGEIRDLLHLCDRILPNSQARMRPIGRRVRSGRRRSSRWFPTASIAEFGVPADPAAFRQHFGVHGPVPAERGQRRAAQESAPAGARSRPKWVSSSCCWAAFATPATCAIAWRRAAATCATWVRSIMTTRCCKSAYRACEVFVLPSLLETPGLAALEAAAQGARVVITEVGARANTLGRWPTYVDPASASSLRAASIANGPRRSGDGVAPARVGQLHLGPSRQGPGRRLRTDAVRRGKRVLNARRSRPRSQDD